MKKKAIALILIIIIMTFLLQTLSSCGLPQDGGGDIHSDEKVIEIDARTEHIEAFIYQLRKQTEIHQKAESHILGFDVTDEMEIVLLVVEQSNDETATFFTEHIHNHDAIVRYRIDELLPQELKEHEIVQALFVDDNIVISTWRNQDSAIYVLNPLGESVIRLQLNNRPYKNSMVNLTEERILVFDSAQDGSNLLREIDFVEMKWGETFPIVQRNQYDLFPTRNDSQFDILMSDGIYLYGYCMETAEQTILLDWVEVDLSGVLHVGELENNNLSVLTGRQRDVNEWNLELHILSPVLRTALDDRLELVLGGVFIPDEIRRAVTNFNRNSYTYRIYVHDYAGEDWQDGIMRLQVELMTGRGPDIIYDQSGIIINRNIFLDLYPFIDADRDLNRSDFFPNMLSALEGPSGILPMVANSFTMSTIFSTTESVGHIQTWTPSELLALVQETTHMFNPFGSQLSGDVFLRFMLLYSGSELIDWSNFEANLDSESFINLLNTSKYLPTAHERDSDIGLSYGFADPLVSMLRGEQILDLDTSFGPGSFQVYSSVIAEFIALGMPTSEGGVHVLNQTWLMGINAATEHADGAWEFLRSFLLPTAPFEFRHWFFPLRIDLYDELIADLTYPKMDANENGYIVEVPHFEISLSNGRGGFYEFSVYALSDNAANTLRSIVETADIRAQSMQARLWDIINDDLPAFYSGSRTAEETARILQNRVQIFLSEQSRN